MSAGCACDCHVGGAFRPPCNIPGGCGHLHTASRRQAWAVRQEDDHDDGRDRKTFRERLTDALDLLPEQYVHLYLALSEHAGAGERISGTRDDPVPPAVQVEALMRDIAATATTWERIVRDAAHLVDVGESRQESGVAIDRACRTLTAHMDTLLAHPAWAVWAWDDSAGPDGSWQPVDRTGREAATEIIRLSGRCHFMLGVTRVVYRLPLPCPTCGVAALTRENGASEVRCQSCGRGESEERYQWLVKVMAAEQARRGRGQGDGGADHPAVQPA